MDTTAGMREACGIFGCVAAAKWPTQLDVPQIIYLGLIGLQHRGQESSGMVTSEGIGKKLKYHKGMGEVNEVFKNDALLKLRGNLGIGHNMYTTVGESEILRCQPFVVHTLRGAIAVAHNGELTNTIHLREKLLSKGIGLSTSSDTELIAQLLAEPPPDGECNGCDFPARIKRLMSVCSISYALVILYGEYIYAVRDPLGNRPLCLGTIYPPSKEDPTELTEPEGWVMASESCVFFSIGAKYLREVEPGEIVRVSKYGIEHICTIDRPEDKQSAFCIFEYVYFSRTDTIFEGQMVYTVRQRCGRQLAIETPADVDIVSAVPDTAIPAAMGYAAQLNIPYAEVLTKNRYIGRTFIQPSQHLRKLGVSKKFGVLTETFKGKRLALLDDSIVRGNTIGPIIHMLRKAGAKEVHIRIASPPLLYPCYMGINIATREELIANQIPPVQLAEYFGADSLAYLSLEGLVSAVEENIKDLKSKNLAHCTACLTGNYPVPLGW